MYLELEKIKQATTYLSENIDDLYYTKYLKLLYYFDFISVLERGAPVTNDTYYHLPYGPIPTVIKDQLSLLREENRTEEQLVLGDDQLTLKSIFSDIITLEPKGDNQFVIKPKVKTDFNYLSEYERVLLDDIIKEFKNISTKQLVEKTHKEVPYIQTPANNIIDYSLAFYLDRDQILPARTYQFNPELSQSEFFNRQ